MSIVNKILYKTFVKTFYRQNAGLFIFLLLMMFGAVGRVDNAGLLEYHFSLITGMLNNASILLIVLLAWFLYARKVERFVTGSLRKTDYRFLSVINLLAPERAYTALLWVQFLLWLPVLIYASIIAAVGFHMHWYLASLLVMVFNLAILFLYAGWYLHTMRKPGNPLILSRYLVFILLVRRWYSFLLLRFVASERLLLFFVIKLYSCGMLWLMVIHQTPVDYDLRMIYVFYSFGLLGHAVLIHKLREMEENKIKIIRTLPISLPARYLQYAVFYFIIFLPEIISLLILTQGYLHTADAASLIGLGYGILLLLHSLLLIRFFKMTVFLRICLALFFSIFICVVAQLIPYLIIFLLIFPVFSLFHYYYTFEKSE